MAFLKLEELSWPEVRHIDKDHAILFLPISPVEEHGPHLPLGTDFFAARDIAEAAARRIVEHDDSFTTVLAPTIPLGCSDATGDFEGTVSMRGTTMARVAVEICSAFARSGFRYIIISNHHLDSVHLKALLTAIKEVRESHEVQIIETGSRIFFSGLLAEEDAYLHSMGLELKNEVHAEVRETSFIRAFYPHLLKEGFRELPPVLIDVDQAYRKGRKTFKEMGADQGYIGNPAMATEQCGRIHLDELARITADLALRLYRGEDLPEMNDKVRNFLESSVKLD